MDTIYTLNTRSNVFLETVRDQFVLSNRQIRSEIQTMFRDMLLALSNSGLDYRELKSALVPATDRDEVALIFDSRAIQSPSYGAEVIAEILPLLDSRSTQSIRVGDLIASDEHQELVYSILRKFMTQVRSFDFIHSTLLFAVYINNLSKTAIQALHDALRRYDPYLGLIPTRYGSVAKTFLSTTLSDLCIKHRKIVVVAHEDDRSNHENVNITFYPYERLGFEVRSIQEHHFSHFLSYKIEREFQMIALDDDIHFSLNALTENVVPITDMKLLIEEKKFEYLQGARKLVKAGLSEISREDLSRLIQTKIAANYIYNLRYQAAHDTISFNVIIEIPHGATAQPTRVLASLEYLPGPRTLRPKTPSSPRSNAPHPRPASSARTSTPKRLPKATRPAAPPACPSSPTKASSAARPPSWSKPAKPAACRC
jgi:hypothetical protein